MKKCILLTLNISIKNENCLKLSIKILTQILKKLIICFFNVFYRGMDFLSYFLPKIYHHQYLSFFQSCKIIILISTKTFVLEIKLSNSKHLPRIFSKSERNFCTVNPKLSPLPNKMNFRKITCLPTNLLSRHCTNNSTWASIICTWGLPEQCKPWRVSQLQQIRLVKKCKRYVHADLDYSIPRYRARESHVKNVTNGGRN